MEKYLIYLATNLINGKKYIGQTHHNRLKRRISEHISKSANNNTSVIFHNAIKKYGIKNFEFKIIEDNILEEFIDEKEAYYIKFYNTFYKNGFRYNMTLGGQGTHGYVFTEEDKNKQSLSGKAYWNNIKVNDPIRYNELCQIRSKALKNVPKSEEHKQNLSIARKKYCKIYGVYNKGIPMSEAQKIKLQQVYTEIYKDDIYKINKFDLQTGKLLQTFNNVSEAARSLAEDPKQIHTIKGRLFAVCKANKGHAYGFIWRKYKKGQLNIPEEELKLEHRPAKAVPICQYDLDGNFIAEFDSAAMASKQFSDEYKKQRGIAKNICKVLKNKAKIAYNYIWRYKNDNN